MAITDEQLAQSKGIQVAQVQLLRESRGASNDTLGGLPPAALRRAIRRLNVPDLPRARHAFRLQQERDDHGDVPANALADAVAQLHAMQARPQADAAGRPAGAARRERAAGLTLAGWEWLGPGNIGGRTRGLVIHPTQPDRMWAASAGGGVWHTADGGAHWAPADDFMLNLACSCIAMDPNRPDTMYVGTGEGFSNADALLGSGIFRTTDAVTWTRLAATATPDFRMVNRIAISRSGTVVLAATATGVHRSAATGRSRWTRTLDTPVGDVRFHPTDSRRAVAGALDAGLAWFTRDGGRTWRPATHGPWSGRVEMAYSVKNPDIVYASVQMTTGEIWRSTDGGETYSPRKAHGPDGGPAPYLGDQGWYDNAIWAGDPTNEDLVVVGGINLWRSTDGGDTLAEISTWWDPRSAHADQHGIVAHPAYDGEQNRTVFFTNDGGVFKAADLAAVGGEDEPPYIEGWSELVNAFGVTQFYGGSGNAASGKIVGGAQDNGTLCFDPALGTERWTTIFGGDGGWCAADPTDPDVFYGEYVFANVHRNLDGGTTDDLAGDRYISGQFWNALIGDWDWKPVPYRIPDAMNQKALFIAPLVLDPNDADRLLVGGLSLWRTEDAKAPNTPTTGPSWQSIKPPAGSRISAIAVARGASDVVWVGHTDGKAFRSTDATSTQPRWDRVGVGGASPLTPQRYCTCITIDPDDHDVVYVAFGGYVNGNVWVTRNGGADWTDLSSGLPAAPVRAIAVHPRRTNLVYLGTEVGVFASDDAGATWSPTNQGPTNCSVDDLFWMDETLVSATHGRGMFQIDLSNV